MGKFNEVTCDVHLRLLIQLVCVKKGLIESDHQRGSQSNAGGVVVNQNA
jgi:hypothetical protein